MSILQNKRFFIGLARFNNKTAEENKFDGREHLGLPSSFKNQ